MDAPIDFLLITPLTDERDAVLRKFGGLFRQPADERDTRTYYTTDFQTDPLGGTGSTYRVALLPLLNMGRIDAATATADALRRWQPRYVMLIGIAGGFHQADVELGDVLIADKLADYEQQKLVRGAAEVRWVVYNADIRLLSAAKNLTAAEWVPLVEMPRPSNVSRRAHVHFGTVLTGDKVDASGATAAFLDVWPKAVGVEMEAGGVGAAAFQAAKVPGVLMIRGVSDLADANKDRAQSAGWREYACDVAASFACGLLRSEPVPIQQSTSLPSGVRSSEDAARIREKMEQRLLFLQLRKAQMGYDAAVSLDMEIDELKRDLESLEKTGR